MISKIRTLLKQSAVYGLGNLLIQGAKFLLIPLYTQFLSPADYGILSVVGTYETIISIFIKLGLDSAAMRLHYDFGDNEEERRSYYGTVWIFLLLAALVGVGLLIWNGEAIFRILFKGIPFYPYGLLATILAFTGTASILPLVLFRVREQPFYYILASFLRFMISTLLIIYFIVFLGQKAEGSLNGQILAEAILFIPFVIVAFRNFRFRFNFKYLKESLNFGLPIVPHQLSAWALSMSDRIILNQFVSLSEQGLYSLGYRFGMVMDAILGSVNLAWAPLFYRMAASEENAPQSIAKITTYYLAAVVYLGIGISCLSRDVIRIMATPAFFDAYRIVEVVVLGFIMHGLYYMVVNQLFYAKRTKRLPIYTMISAGVNIGLNLLTVPKYGIIAAAWNTVIGYAILFLLVFLESRQVYPIPYEYRRLGILLLAALSVYLPTILINVPNPWLNFALRSLVLGMYPFLLLLIHFFTPSELKGIKKLALQAYSYLPLPKNLSRG